MSLEDDWEKAQNLVVDALTHHRAMVGKPGEPMAKRDLEKALETYWEQAEKIPLRR
jgi:hypothetical protein